MPVLAGLLVSMFSCLVDFFVRWLTKKAAIGLAAVAVFAGLTLVLWAAIGAALATVVAVVPADSYFLMGMWVAIPDNAQAVVSATVACDTAIALYRWNVQNLRLMSYVT